MGALAVEEAVLIVVAVAIGRALACEFGADAGAEIVDRLPVVEAAVWFVAGAAVAFGEAVEVVHVGEALAEAEGETAERRIDVEKPGQLDNVEGVGNEKL